MIYFIAEHETDGPVKIGYVAEDNRELALKSVSARLAALQVGNHRALMVLALAPGGAVQERRLHKRFIDHRLRGEWFTRTPDLASMIIEHSNVIPARSSRRASAQRSAIRHASRRTAPVGSQPFPAWAADMVSLERFRRG